MLATRISFMNELSILADATGADIEHVRLGIGADQRIGYSFLYAGIGYGGSCLPKDIRALQKTAGEHGIDLHLVSALSAVNDRQKRLIVDKIVRRFGDDLSGKRFGLWGLAFKPNTDDMREAPSLEIIKGLAARRATVVAYDPIAMDNAKSIFKDISSISYAATPMEAATGSDALIIATEWREFKSPDFAALKSALKVPAIFDGRNLYDPHYVSSFGLEYHAMGRLVPSMKDAGR
jgi:UDPglucose 6-dehydrogenase